MEKQWAINNQVSEPEVRQALRSRFNDTRRLDSQQAVKLDELRDRLLEHLVYKNNHGHDLGTDSHGRSFEEVVQALGAVHAEINEEYIAGLTGADRDVESIGFAINEVSRRQNIKTAGTAPKAR